MIPKDLRSKARESCIEEMNRNKDVIALQDFIYTIKKALDSNRIIDVDTNWRLVVSQVPENLYKDLERDSQEIYGNYRKVHLSDVVNASLRLANHCVETPDLIQVLEDECWDLRCESFPINGPRRYDTQWRVYGHWSKEPIARPLGSGKTPLAAIRDAMMPKDYESNPTMPTTIFIFKEVEYGVKKIIVKDVTKEKGWDGVKTVESFFKADGSLHSVINHRLQFASGVKETIRKNYNVEKEEEIESCYLKTSKKD